MTNQKSGNNLKVHRRRCGLTQRELGLLVGYADECQTQRHELALTIPPLLIAFAYEVVFQVPLSAIFVGFRTEVARAVEANVKGFKQEFQQRVEGRQLSTPALRKLQWLTERTTL